MSNDATISDLIRQINQKEHELEGLRMELRRLVAVIVVSKGPRAPV